MVRIHADSFGEGRYYTIEEMAEAARERGYEQCY
jgi:hypothetical protein